jgi:hypothetical protein
VVIITGTGVTLIDTQIEVRGEPGGKIRIGGDVRGGHAIHAATSVDVDHLTTMRADAAGRGDGGSVVLWSEQRTRFAGHISARGGAAGGQGGSVEVSSKEVLTYRGTIDVTAPQGKAGSVLFDPRTLRINTSVGAVGTVTGNQFFNQSPISDIDMLPSALTNILNTGANLTLEANRDLLVQTDLLVNNPLGSGGTLTLRAGRSVIFSAVRYASDGGGLNIEANSASASALTRGNGQGVLDLGAAIVNLGAGAISLQVGPTTLNYQAGTLTLPTALAAGAVDVSGGATSVEFLALASISAVSVTISGAAGPINLRTSLVCAGAISFNVATTLSIQSSAVVLSGSTVRFQGPVAGGNNVLRVEAGEVEILAALGSLAELRLNVREGATQQIWVGGPEQGTDFDVTSAELAQFGGVNSLVIGDATGALRIDAFDVAFDGDLTFMVPYGDANSSIDLRGSIDGRGSVLLHGDVQVFADIEIRTDSGQGLSVVADALGTVGTINGVGFEVSFITDILSAIPVVSIARFAPVATGTIIAVGTTSGSPELLIPASIIQARGGATGQWIFGDSRQPLYVHFGSFSAPLLDVVSPDPLINVRLGGTMVCRSATFAGNAATTGIAAPHITTAAGITFGSGLLILATAGGGLTLLDPAANYSFAHPPSNSNQQAFLRLAPPTGNMYVAAPGTPGPFNLSETVLAMLDGTFSRVELGDSRQMNITLYDRRGAYGFSMRLVPSGSSFITFASQGNAIEVTGSLEAGTSLASQIVLNNSISASGRLTLRGFKRVETSIALSSTAFVTGMVLEGPMRIGSSGVIEPSITLTTPGTSAIDGLDLVGAFGDCTVHGQLTNAVGIDVLGNIVVDHAITAPVGATDLALSSSAGTLALGNAVNAGAALLRLQASEVSFAGNLNTTGDVWITANGGRDLTFASASDSAPSLDLTSAKIARFIGTSRMRLVANAIDLQAFTTAWRVDLLCATRATFHDAFITSSRVDVTGELHLTPGTTLQTPQLQVLGTVYGTGTILADTFSSLGAQAGELTIRTLTPGRPIVLGTSSVIAALLINWRSNVVSGKVTIGDAAGSSALSLNQPGFISSYWPADLTLAAGVGLPISIEGTLSVSGKVRFESPISVPGIGYVAVRHNAAIGSPLVPDLYFAAGGWVGGTLTILSTWFDTAVPFTGDGEIIFADPDDAIGRELTVNGPSILPGPALSLTLLEKFSAGGASLGFASFGGGNMRLYGGPVAIDFPMHFYIYQQEGKLHIDGAQGPLLLGPSGGLFVTGPGTTIIINTDILSQGAPIELDDGVEIAAPDITIATDANGAVAGAPITFMRQLNSSSGEFNNLSLSAGTGGQIEFIEQVGASSPNLLGSLQVLSAASVLVSGGLVATRDHQVYAAAMLIGADVLFDSSSGAIEFGGLLQADESALTLRAAEIDFAGLVSGTSTFNIETDLASRDIELLGVDDPAQLDLTASDMANISAGFESLTIGRSDGSGLLLVSGDLIFLSDAELRMPAQGGIIRSTRPIRGSDGTRITITGPGTTFETAGGIITRGGQIVINDGVRLLDDSLFDTTDAGTFAAGAQVSINGRINSEPAAGHGLVFRAGAAAVALLGEIGTGLDGALGFVEVNAAGGVAIDGGIIRTLGTQIYNAPASFGNGTTFASSGGDVTFNGIVSGIPTVQVVPGTGIVTFNQPVGLIGAFAAGTGQIFVFNAGVQFGTLTVSGGSVAINNAPATAATLLLSGSGTLTGTAPISITGGGTITGGRLDGAAAMHIAAGATVSHPSGVLSVQRPVTVSGTYSWTSGTIALEAGTLLSVAAGGVLSLTGAGALTGGTLANAGRISIAAITPLTWSQVRIQNTSGTFELLLGQMHLVMPPAFTFENAARLSLTGSARLLIAGDYQQTAGATLAINIIGMGATSLVPRLDVAGTASIAGTLAITLLGTFSNSALGSVAIVTAANLTGRFSQTLLSAAAGAKGISLLFTQSGTQLTLSLNRVASARI